MNRNRHVQFMVDAETDVSKLEDLDIDITTDTLETGETLLRSVNTHPVDDAHEIERTINTILHTSDDE